MPKQRDSNPSTSGSDSDETVSSRTASLAHQEFYHTECLFSFQSSNYNPPSLINLNLFPQRVPVQLRKRAGQLVQRHHGAGEPPRGSRLPAVDFE